MGVVTSTIYKLRKTTRSISGIFWGGSSVGRARITGLISVNTAII